jgi:hypothetical protein
VLLLQLTVSITLYHGVLTVRERRRRKARRKVFTIGIHSDELDGDRDNYMFRSLDDHQHRHVDKCLDSLDCMLHVEL